jgi:hypothetical protein
MMCIMRRLCLVALVVALLASGTAPAAGQSDETEPHPLLAMLAMVPDTEPVRAQSWSAVRYADFQALYIAEGIEELRVTAGTEVLLDSVPLASMLWRLVAGPEALQFVFRGINQMPEVVGFEWFAAVNRSLEYGAPPYTGLILNGAFEPEAIGAALSARGFTQTDVNGVPVWHRFEDAQVSFQDVEPADPFGGRLGMAARIAIWPEYLANSRYWEMTEAITAATQGEQPSLADEPNYRALAEAITTPEGLLLQALFLNVADVGFIPEDVFAMLTESAGVDPTEKYGPLMPYALAVLADRQEAQDQVHLIGLVYPNAAYAEAAAEEVARRIRVFTLPGQSDEVLVERFGALVASRVYESETTGQAVAIVEVRYPLPAERIDPETGFFVSGGLMYQMWARALVQQAFSPLVIVAE